MASEKAEVSFTGLAARLMTVCTICLAVAVVSLLPTYLAAVMFPDNAFATNAMTISMAVGLLGLFSGIFAMITQKRVK